MAWLENAFIYASMLFLLSSLYRVSSHFCFTDVDRDTQSVPSALSNIPSPVLDLIWLSLLLIMEEAIL